jgi:4-hydroxybenzoate polyprenyltransferase
MTVGAGVPMPAAFRIIHPAPALAVVTLTAALAAVIDLQAGNSLDGRVLLLVLAVAGSQVATGALNDWADRDRDAQARPEKPIPAGEISPRGALGVAALGALIYIAAAAPLGAAVLALGLVGLASAQAYNLALSRTPLSFLPYLVSFGILPAWIALGLGLPLARVLPAVILVAPFAAAAHLANTLRDWEADAAGGSRSLAQVLGRRRSQALAVGLALAVGIVVAVTLAFSGHLRPMPALLGLGGLVAVAQGARSARRLWDGILVAAVCWTAAWALSTG